MPPRTEALSASEEPIEVRRYLQALRRSRWLIAGVAVLLAAVVTAVSATLPQRYEATATIVKQSTTGPADTTDVASLTRELATLNRLLTTPDGLAAAARRLPGESATSLKSSVRSAVDGEANLIAVTATAGSPRHAANVANAVAQTFVDGRRALALRQNDAARFGLAAELARVQAQPDAAQQQQAIRQRLSDLAVSRASAGADLAVAQRATPPTAAASPKPLRNGLLALFAGLVLGVLLALVRDQLAPRIGGSRELARAVGLPLIAAVPETPRRRRGGSRPASPAEHEAYQSLAASVRFALPADAGPQILFVTSTLPDEGKSTVTAALGRALARIGQRTLLVSADLRSPTLDARVGASVAPGLTDVLRRAAEPGPAVAELVSDVIVAVPDPPGGAALDLLPSGTPAEDPARLLAGPVMGAVLYALGHLDYAYVLVDVAPVLGLADTQALARHMHHVVYVARTHRLSPDAVLDARDVLDRFEVRPLGLVVLGVRGEPSPGYARRGSGRVLEKT